VPVHRHVIFVVHVLLVLTGQAGGNATAPCPYCERKLIISTSLKQQLTCGRMRSCNSNRVHYRKLCDSGDMSDHKNYASCVADPLDVFPQDIHIIEWCKLPQLHCHLFLNWFINHIERYMELSKWFSLFNQTRSDYHGGDFNGPQLYRLTRTDGMTHVTSFMCSVYTLYFDVSQRLNVVIMFLHRISSRLFTQLHVCVFTVLETQHHMN